jgi:AraC-like DNA-binding protein
MHRDFSKFPVVLVRARALTGFASLVERHGGDLAKLLDHAGIPAATLAVPEAPVLLARAMTLLEDAAAALDVPDFGLQLSLLQDINVLGAVALFARHSATLGDALAAIARNLPYHSPGVQLHIEDDPDRPGHSQLRLVLDTGVAIPRRQSIELSFGIAQHFLTMAAGPPGPDWQLSLSHDSPLDAAHYRRYFSGQVLLKQRKDALSFPSRLLASALSPDTGALHDAAQRYVSNVIHRFPLDITRQVEALVDRQLAAGGGSLIQVARELGLHERTLQRRLKEQGVYFEDLVDALRRSRAEEFLAYPAIPLAQVAALLGYSEQSSFIRVCKRWFGATPQVFRTRCIQARESAGRSD